MIELGVSDFLIFVFFYFYCTIGVAMAIYVIRLDPARFYSRVWYHRLIIATFLYLFWPVIFIVLRDYYSEGD